MGETGHSKNRSYQVTDTLGNFVHVCMHAQLSSSLWTQHRSTAAPWACDEFSDRYLQALQRCSGEVSGRRSGGGRGDRGGWAGSPRGGRGVARVGARALAADRLHRRHRQLHAVQAQLRGRPHPLLSARPNLAPRERIKASEVHHSSRCDIPCLASFDFTCMHVGSPRLCKNSVSIY